MKPGFNRVSTIAQTVHTTFEDGRAIAAVPVLLALRRDADGVEQGLAEGLNEELIEGVEGVSSKGVPGVAERVAQLQENVEKQRFRTVVSRLQAKNYNDMLSAQCEAKAFGLLLQLRFL